MRLREYAQDLSAIRNLIVVFLDRYNRALEAHVALLLGAVPPAPPPALPAEIVVVTPQRARRRV